MKTLISIQVHSYKYIYISTFIYIHTVVRILRICVSVCVECKCQPANINNASI